MREESLLWGPPAFAIAILLGRGFEAHGWRFEHGIDPELGGLPWVVQTDGAAPAPVCVARDALSERDVMRLAEGGVMSLAAVAGKNAVRLSRLHSVALNSLLLFGRGGAA